MGAHVAGGDRDDLFNRRARRRLAESEVAADGLAQQAEGHPDGLECDLAPGHRHGRTAPREGEAVVGGSGLVDPDRGETREHNAGHSQQFNRAGRIHGIFARTQIPEAHVGIRQLDPNGGRIIGTIRQQGRPATEEDVDAAAGEAAAGESDLAAFDGDKVANRQREV